MNASSLQDFIFFGSRLRAPFPLPSLPVWPVSAAEGAPDVEIRLGETPASLADPLWSSPFVQVGKDRSALINVAAVGRFWLPDGGRVIVQPSQGAQDFEVETILLGTVAGILLHQRSRLPLHASCVVLDGRAIVLSGSSASGKSLLAAALVRRGARLAADDLCVLDASGGSVQVIGGTGQARLWPDAMNWLETPPELRLPTRSGHGKCAVSMIAAEAHPWPLHLLVRLGVSNLAAEPTLERQQGLGSIFPPDGLVYQREIGQLLGNAGIEFSGITALARQVTRVSLTHRAIINSLDPCVELILRAAREGV
jgi:hypothetical protein